jgi:hypothetical protein
MFVSCAVFVTRLSQDQESSSEAIMPTDLLNLSWQVQVALASGYAAYLLCYAGVRGSHTTIDTTFSTLVFSLIATAVLYLSRPCIPDIAAGTLAFVVTCASGVLWRRFLRQPLRWAMHALDVSWSDDDPSALATLLANSKYPVSQIGVLLDDGTWVGCDDMSKFKDAPFGPCKLGPSGDVALYLTYELSADGKVKELETVRDPFYGDRVTYIPASRIKQITFRHLSKKVSCYEPEAVSADLQEPTAASDQ